MADAHVLERLSSHLRANACNYFTAFEGKTSDAHLVGGGGRVLSSVYRFRLSAGETRRDVIVKLPGPVDKSPCEGRPRLRPIAERRLKTRFEHTALCAIEAHFSRLGDARFGTIRILDFLPEEQAIVMERAAQPSLKSLMARTNRLQRPFVREDVPGATRNAGAWLRSYHTANPIPGSKIRNESRAHFEASIARFTDYLGLHRGERGYFDRVRDRVLAAARHALPETLPTGMGHGDFAPRNILVGPGTSVTVFDTLGTWRPPIYEDIGFFAGGLRTTRVQAMTWGAAFSRNVLDAQERAFLEGYFGGEAFSYEAIRLFTIQALLEKWCAHADDTQRFARDTGNFAKSWASRAIDAGLRREIERVLQALAPVP